jgi:hypothetical protein
MNKFSRTFHRQISVIIWDQFWRPNSIALLHVADATLSNMAACSTSIRAFGLGIDSEGIASAQARKKMELWKDFSNSENVLGEFIVPYVSDALPYNLKYFFMNLPRPFEPTQGDTSPCVSIREHIRVLIRVSAPLGRCGRQEFSLSSLVHS